MVSVNFVLNNVQVGSIESPCYFYFVLAFMPDYAGLCPVPDGGCNSVRNIMPTMPGGVCNPV
ncbi:Uncharacterized protein dnm_094800 [Desulfonema magnum]|uniref:Uncharacterized protein n=1 Tax=Desulfonema magnum TaxID=45655 RepID=A0A975BX27_9BACT|nr:Uncharacterized protein dnm_094800 [Desulfonema magnum]